MGAYSNRPVAYNDPCTRGTSRLLKNAPAACCERSEPGPHGPPEGAPSEERGAGRANEE